MSWCRILPRHFSVAYRGLSRQTGDGIGDGDLLIVDRAVEPYDGCIAVCYVDGEFTVKRVKLEAAGAWLLPSNPAYPPIRVDADNEFSIWGVVRHVVKTFK